MPPLIFDTWEGSIVCRLFEKNAPKMVANFIEPAEGKREMDASRQPQEKQRPPL
jgi:cyclophilin family peptidyl-prolyl cis-trans isomerase